MCRELKGKQALASVLRAAHKITLQMYTSNEIEDDFRDLLDAPQIQRKHLYTAMSDWFSLIH